MSSSEFGIAASSIDRVESLIANMDKLADSSKKARINYDRFNTSLRQTSFTDTTSSLSKGLLDSTTQSTKLSKEIVAVNKAMMDIVNNTSSLSNSLKKVKSASLSGIKGSGKKKGPKSRKDGGLGFLANAAQSLLSSYTKGSGAKKGKGGKGGGLGFLANAAESLLSSYTKGSGAKKGKGGKGGGLGFLASAAQSLLSSYTKGSGAKKGKGGKGGGLGFLANAAESLLSSYTKGSGAKKGKGGKGVGLGFLANAAESLLSSYTKGSGGKKGKGGKGGGLGFLASAAESLLSSYTKGSGAKKGKGGGGLIDLGLKSIGPMVKKIGLKTALNPFKQIELVKMAAVGGWKVGSWINKKIEKKQKANQLKKDKEDNKEFSKNSGDMIAAKKSGDRAAQFRAVANMWKDQGNMEKANEYYAKAEKTAKIQNQVNLNIKIDEKGRVMTETSDMDTNSKVTAPRGVM
ncbi:MAG: hypothetical protein OEV42_15170 [Deltaproteobacteria bacterium]|nr:hypothetical protein [Deltaproteobacteria bacterium]